MTKKRHGRKKEVNGVGKSVGCVVCVVSLRLSGHSVGIDEELLALPDAAGDP